MNTRSTFTEWMYIQRELDTSNGFGVFNMVLYLRVVCGPQDLQKELQNQQGSIDSTRESLNTLCRKYPSEELAGLGSALTDLIKSYEAVNQLSARTLGSLQHVLQHHFNGGQTRVKGVGTGLL